MQNPYQPLTEPSGDQGGGVAAAKDEGLHQASELKDTAAEAVSEVAAEAKDKVSNVAQDAKSQLSNAASQQEDRAVQLVRQGSEQLRALAQGNTSDAGPLGSYVEQLADSVERFSSTLEQKGVSGVVRDVESFARRQPMLFLGGCLVAGIAVGRLARNASSSGDDTIELPATTGTYGNGSVQPPQTGLGGTPTPGYGAGTGSDYGTGSGYGTGSSYGSQGGYGTTPGTGSTGGYGTTPGTGSTGGSYGGGTGGTQEPYPSSTGGGWPAPGTGGGQV